MEVIQEIKGIANKPPKKLSIFRTLPIKHKCVIAQPLIERMNLEPYLFRQCGTHFIKDGWKYKRQTKDLCRQARLAGINYKCTD